jgi:hypothetical protein
VVLAAGTALVALMGINMEVAEAKEIFDEPASIQIVAVLDE